MGWDKRSQPLVLGRDPKPHTALCWLLVLGVPAGQGAAARWVVLALLGKLYNENRNCDQRVLLFFWPKGSEACSLPFLNVVWLNLNHSVQPKRKGSAWCQGGHFSCLATSEESWLCSYTSEARL